MNLTKANTNPITTKLANTDTHQVRHLHSKSLGRFRLGVTKPPLPRIPIEVEQKSATLDCVLALNLATLARALLA